MSEQLKVLIIGAGMSGLSAADHLQENGIHDWKIFEASERCGGRIKSTQFGSSFVEEGANWIHGACPTNSIFMFGNQHRLIPNPPSINTRSGGTYFTSNGSVINPDLAAKAYDFFKEVERRTSKLEARKDLSLKTFLKNEFQILIRDSDITERDSLIRLLNHFIVYVGMHGGDDADLQSAWGYGRYDELPGGDVRLPTGYQTFVDMLASRLPSNKILFNHKVVEIRWDCHPNIVVCEGGQQVKADIVLVTLPLGVLKHQRNIFTPNLSKKKNEAIERTGFGRVCKIFMEYNTPFWQPGTLKIANLAWSDEDIDKWRDCGNFWATKLLAFEEITSNPNVIFSWLGGENATLVETLPEEYVKQVLTTVLQMFLGNPTIPHPDRILVTKWCTDDCIRGSYSYPSMDSEENDIEILGEPVVREGMLKVAFGGEATHKRFFSTVHGARSAGIREAERIIQLVKKSKL